MSFKRLLSSFQCSLRQSVWNFKDMILILQLNFYYYVIKLIYLIHKITFSFPIIGSILIPYFALVKSKLEYSSVAWNSAKIADSSKLEHVLWKFVARCHYKVFQDIEYQYDNLLENFKLNFLTLYISSIIILMLLF